jgi:hypothetical protein
MLKKRLLIPIIIALMFFSVTTYAAERNNDQNSFYIGLSAIAGSGFEEYELGQNDHGEEVEFYGGGGGLGGMLTLGFSPFDRVDFELSAGYQKYDDDEVPYTDVAFRRFIYLATLKFELIRFKSSNIKFGFGAGLYSEPRLNIEIETDQDYIQYDDAIGYHALIEYEILFKKNWALTVGLKGYTVEYEAEEYRKNGTDQNVSTLDEKLRDFNGDGLDLMVSVVKYF